MNDILELIENGQWTDAIKKYQRLTITPQQFSNFMNGVPARLVADVALLGYYAKEQK